eukprot:TRINITY_DN14683_c0_g1_i2.p1 TRINITY_DN14683_c0_g1~~TRINITY_DN14683_c0_g1_i2.p1  ORF type:complete len:726 (-),score=103.77 TRINITY_DN14683_c0_g1_i2:10-1911(-)
MDAVDTRQDPAWRPFSERQDYFRRASLAHRGSVILMPSTQGDLRHVSNILQRSSSSTSNTLQVAMDAGQSRPRPRGPSTVGEEDGDGERKCSVDFRDFSPGNGSTVAPTSMCANSQRGTSDSRIYDESDGEGSSCDEAPIGEVRPSVYVLPSDASMHATLSNGESQEPLQVKKDYLMPRSHAPTPVGDLGLWSYVCVDPLGVRIRRWRSYSRDCKTGEELHYGEMVMISERGRDGSSPGDILWLRLADGRGWVFERTNRQRVSEVQYDAVVADYQQAMVLSPRKTALVDLRPTPHVAVGGRGVPSVGHAEPGAAVRVLAQATVKVQHPSKRQLDVNRSFLKVRVLDGARAVGDVLEGWIMERSDGPSGLSSERNLSPYRCDYSTKWISVISSSGANTYNQLSCFRSSGKLAPGQLIMVNETRSVDGMVFFNVGEGCWVPERNAKDAKHVEVVEREEHAWAYVCDDKDGATIRHHPTRLKTQNVGRELKHRQQALVTELVRFPSGDCFLHLDKPEEGWVPRSKIRGGQKMRPVMPREVASAAGGMDLSVPAGSASLAGSQQGVDKMGQLRPQRAFFSRPPDQQHALPDTGAGDFGLPPPNGVRTLMHGSNADPDFGLPSPSDQRAQRQPSAHAS